MKSSIKTGQKKTVFQKHKLRWYPERYPQQPQRFVFTNLSEACCEAKRWNLLQNLLNLTWLCTKAQGFLEPSPEPSPEPC